MSLSSLTSSFPNFKLPEFNWAIFPPSLHWREGGSRVQSPGSHQLLYLNFCNAPHRYEFFNSRRGWHVRKAVHWWGCIPRGILGLSVILQLTHFVSHSQTLRTREKWQLVMEGLVLSLLTGPARNSTSRAPVPHHSVPCESASTCIWSWQVGAWHLHGHLGSLLRVPVAQALQGPQEPHGQGPLGAKLTFSHCWVPVPQGNWCHLEVKRPQLRSSPPKCSQIFLRHLTPPWASCPCSAPLSWHPTQRCTHWALSPPPEPTPSSASVVEHQPLPWVELAESFYEKWI